MVRRAGQLDRRITLEAFGLSQDGDPTAGQWAPVRTRYAARVEMGQLKRFVADQDLAEATRAYRIRYLADVDPASWRVKDGEELWRIVGVPEGEGRRRETVLLCSRYVPNDREFE